MFLTVLALSLVLLGMAMLGIGIKVFFSKDKKFPESRIGHNKDLRKKGIYCAKTEQRLIDRNFKVKHKEISCASCD